MNDDFHRCARPVWLLAAIAPLLAVLPHAAAQPPVSEELVARFKRTCADRAAEADKADTMTVVGRDGWLFLGKELRHLGVGKFWGQDAARVSRATKPDQADPLPAILDFQAQLKQTGIELLLVPVPPKAIIFPDKICDAVTAGDAPPPRLDPELQAFYKLLGDQGVSVLDLTSEFLTHRADADVPLYCRQDSHWSGAACVLAAQRIARAVERQPGLGDEKKREVSGENRSVEIAGDLWQALAGSKPPAESIALRFVGSPTAATPIEPERASPVVLLGDSHNLVFHSGGDMHAKGAGLPDQLALEWGFPVDLVAVRGSGATPARINLLRQARANPKYMAGKKLLIWCFAAREFTEAVGWQKVPVIK